MKTDLTQAQIESLQQKFGATKVSNYIEIADYLAKDTESIDTLVKQINKGTAEMAEIQKAVRQLYEKGKTQEEIAKKLGLSLGTVNNHLRGK